jgi:hypothetical protein
MKNETVSKFHDKSEYRGTSQPRGFSAAQAMDRARSLFCELTGAQAETVSSVERTRDGWRLVLEIVELQRIPATTDILAQYVVNIDSHGELLGYHRVSRHFRSDVRGA